MTRVKRGENAHRRHREVVKAAKGYRGLRSRTFRQAKNAVMKAGMNSYTHRRTKKREFRRLWIARINAACRPLGITYSRLIASMTLKGITVNRKMLSELAIHEPAAFEAVINEAKA
mgnify:CR=1 FL=1